MPIEKYANAFVTTLTAPMSAGDLTATVNISAPADLQGGQFRISIQVDPAIPDNNELLLVTAGASTTTWTVTRAVEGTTAVSHASGSTVASPLTRASLLGATGVFDVRAFGAKGDHGATDDTAAIQAAFDAVPEVTEDDWATRGWKWAASDVVLPPGIFRVGTINYRGQSIRGAGMYDTILLGKPGQDVLHLDPTLGSTDVQGIHWRDFTIRVDDSTDASASFPQRGGVGNACFAADWANGSAAHLLRLTNIDISNVQFESTSSIGGGRNKSCGIYDQGGVFNIHRMRNPRFYRLAYGWWDDAPTSNVASSSLYRDHFKIDAPYFNGCGYGWRLGNAGYGTISNLIMHSCTHSLITKAWTASDRSTVETITFSGTTYIEFSYYPVAFDPKTYRLVFDNLLIAPSGAPTETPIPFGFSNSVIHNLLLATDGTVPVLYLTGNQNFIRIGSAGGTSTDDNQWDRVTEAAGCYGNRVEALNPWGGDAAAFGSSSQRAAASALPDSRLLYARDALPMLSGHVSPMPVNLADLLISPRQLTPFVYDGSILVEGVDWSRVVDATADFKEALRITATTGYWNTNLEGRVGNRWPRTKVRIYVKAKITSGSGNQAWHLLDSANVLLGTGTITVGTAYSVGYFDADLSAATVGDWLKINAYNLSAGSGPLDIAWIAFRPWSADMLSVGNVEVNAVSGGLILKSPDGTRYIAKIANGGTWTITAA